MDYEYKHLFFVNFKEPMSAKDLFNVDDHCLHEIMIVTGTIWIRDRVPLHIHLDLIQF